MQPSQQVAKILFEHSDIPQILICTGKNALEYAYSVLENNSINFEKIFIFQARGYENINSKYNSKVTLFLVDHPIPSQVNFKFSKHLLNYLENLKNLHFIHFIITGGTSSCLVLPESGLNKSDYIKIIESTFVSGFDIHQLNEIRSTIDMLKGGKLSVLLEKHFLKTSIISDVFTNDPRIVGSGPTIPGIVLAEETKIFLESLISKLRMSLNLTELFDKLTEVSKYKHPHHNWSIIASNVDFSEILLSHLLKKFTSKYECKIVSSKIQEDVKTFASTVYKVYLELSTPSILIWLGELSIEISKEMIHFGKGGRLSYFSFLIAELFRDTSDALVISFATDGQDGSSPKSCYIINGSTYDQISQFDDLNPLLESGNTGLIMDEIQHSLAINITNINLADVIILIKN